MILCKYRSGEDLRLEWFRRDEAPPELHDDNGRVWVYEPPVPRDTTQAVKKTIDGFVSYQLPKWYKHAPRHDEKGRCVFHSQREALETKERARAAGEELDWDN